MRVQEGLFAYFLGGGNSNIFYFHPENWGRLPSLETQSAILNQPEPFTYTHPTSKAFVERAYELIGFP